MTKATKSQFKRGLTDNHLAALKSMIEPCGNNWWKDLLRHWVPSGGGSDGAALRLAVRGNYLNFYRQGQAVAKVRFGRKSLPRLEVHAKYAVEKESRGTISGQKHVAYTGAAGNLSPEDAGPHVFRYSDSLIKCLVTNAEDWTGEEKRGVDNIVGANDHIIDLEMGLPGITGPGGKKGASRIDIVALETDGDRIDIVFWEAKCFGDHRLRGREGDAAVVEQLQRYETYFSEDPTRRAMVISAYIKACCVVRKIHDMAKTINPDIRPLADVVLRLAERSATDGSVGIVARPRIVVLSPNSANASEEKHREHMEKLRSSGYRVLDREVGIPRA